MISTSINLPTIADVQRFVEKISPLPGNFDLQADGYVLDAKSLMGILSLDLTKPIRLTIQYDTPETLRAIRPFLDPGQTEITTMHLTEIIAWPND